VQYDFGKTVGEGRFQRTGTVNQPPQILLTAVSKLQSRSRTENRDYISEVLSQALDKDLDNKDRFSRPSPDQDHLFDAKYDHAASENTCDNCDLSRTVPRASRNSNDPQVHYGLIGSGNRVMKDAATRDRLAQEENASILCYEMEAAGFMNLLPCLVIRGICDYSDSHKNKKWQGYAALAAAAYAKQLLSV